MSDTESTAWRVGRKVGRTLYREEKLVGVMDTPELANEVVAAVNESTDWLHARLRENMDLVSELRGQVHGETAKKNGAYGERNQVVAALARMALALGWQAGVREHPAEDKTWEDDWRTLVFIDLPTGQVSWHFHDSEKHLLAGLPRYVGSWDGHSTEEKYRRCAALSKAHSRPGGDT